MPAITYQREDSCAPVQDLPVLAPLPPNPRLPKIEVEAAFAVRCTVAVLDKDGKPDWSWFIIGNGLNQQSIEALSPRLQDFETIRLQSMDETGVEYCVCRRQAG